MYQEPVEVVFGKGNIPDVPDARDHTVPTASLRKTDTTAPHFTIFGTTSPGYQKVVFNQYAVGSCTCNAVAAAYMYELQRQRVPLDEYRPSRLFLYYVARYARIYGKDVKDDGIPSADYYKGFMNNVPAVPLLKDPDSHLRDVIKIMGSLGAPRGFEISHKDDYRKFGPGSAIWPYDRFASSDKHRRFKNEDWPAKAPDSSC